MSPRSRGLLMFEVVAVVAVALHTWNSFSASSPTAPLPAYAPPLPTGYSNIHPQDYVGPEVCGDCHPGPYERWQAHPHRVMNATPTSASVRGDFSGVEVDYAGGRARFEEVEGAYYMTWAGADEVRRYRVTRTVGSRFTQMYVGVQVEGPEPEGDPVYRTEGKLPFGYWFRLERWLPEVYFDSDCPPEYDASGTPTLPVAGTHARAPWQENCIYCHNTYPYELRLAAGHGSEGFPGEPLQLMAPPQSEVGEAGLEPASLVTLGISCESCHLGGREHAEDGHPIAFLPRSPVLEAPNVTAERLEGARRDPSVVNGICAQCHFARGVSPYPDGSGTWNAREAVDFALGACDARCTDCHDPHTAGPPGGGPDQAAHVAACVRCHEAYADADAREDHTQHPEAVSCLDCHMPRIVQGLEQVVRTHRISAPVEASMVSAGAPNACSLCHVERGLGWVLGALRVGWGQAHTPTPEWFERYGEDLERPVGEVYTRHERPIVRLVGADAWSRRAQGEPVARRLLSALLDPYAVNRVFGQFAVERALGRALTQAEYDVLAAPERRRQQVLDLDAELR